MKDKKQVLSLPTTPAGASSQRSGLDTGNELSMHIDDVEEEEEPVQSQSGSIFGSDGKNSGSEDVVVIGLSSEEDTDGETPSINEDEE